MSAQPHVRCMHAMYASTHAMCVGNAGIGRRTIMNTSLSHRSILSMPPALLLMLLSVAPAMVSGGRPEDALIVVGSTPFDDTGVPVSPSHLRGAHIHVLRSAACIKKKQALSSRESLRCTQQKSHRPFDQHMARPPHASQERKDVSRCSLLVAGASTRWRHVAGQRNILLVR